MRIEQFMIGLLIFSMFMVGGALIFADFETNYEIGGNQSLFDEAGEDNSNSAYNVIHNISDTTRDFKTSIIGNESGTTSENGFDVLFSGAFSTVKLVGQSFVLISVIINQISTSIGLPIWLGSAIFIMFILSIVFTIIYMIVRFKP